MLIARALLPLALVLGLTPGVAQAQGAFTVYSSLPLQGVQRPQALAIVQGARLALEEAGGMAGAHPIRYVSLDDSTARAGTWDPVRVSRNARRAAADDSTIAYLGDFNSGASSISIPILNEREIPQISPSNAAIGLTRSGPGAERGEPDKYYPSGRRTFFRIAPTDRVQAGALAVLMRDRGCRRIAVLHDGELYGAGITTLVGRAARGLGLRVVQRARTGVRTRIGRLLRRLRQGRADCVVFGGVAPNGAVRLFRGLARGLPRAQLFGSDGLFTPGFYDPREGGVPRRVGRRVLLTAYPLAADALPESGRAVLQRYAARYGDPTPDPYAVNGYEAMRLVLEGVAAVGPSRAALTGWLRTVRDRASVLGTYGFDRFGDATLRDYGVFRIRNRRVEWAGAVRAP